MKKIKISFILNMLITILVILGTIFMFTGFKFMPDNTLLVATKGEMFKFYTVDSNLLIGLAALILSIYEIRFIKYNKDIPERIYIFKFIATSGITLTFLTTLIFLAPQYGFYAMYNNTNLLFHMIVPLLSLISYIFIEKHDNKYKHALYGIIPMFLYSIFYTINIIIHLNNGGLTYKYDFYGFLRGNIYNAFIVLPLMYIISYIISLLIVFLNKKIRV